MASAFYLNMRLRNLQPEIELAEKVLVNLKAEAKEIEDFLRELDLGEQQP